MTKNGHFMRGTGVTPSSWAGENREHEDHRVGTAGHVDLRGLAPDAPTAAHNLSTWTGVQAPRPRADNARRLRVRRCSSTRAGAGAGRAFGDRAAGAFPPPAVGR